jgi:DNA-binding SARP family transcriptional activator
MDTIDIARRLLEPNLTMPESSAFIKRREQGYVFDATSNVALDYAESEQLLIRGITHQESSEDDAALATYEQALPLHQGEYLPADRFAQWTVPLRNHLQSMYARMLNRMADLYAKRGDFKRAIQTAELCMQQDPYHESTYRRLMRYHSCSGNYEAALTVYLTLEKQRREFFGEEPSPETQALYEAIKSGEPISCIEQPLAH